MNDLILDKQKGIKQLQNDIKLNELDYEAKKNKKKKKTEKMIISVKFHCP